MEHPQGTSNDEHSDEEIPSFEEAADFSPKAQPIVQVSALDKAVPRFVRVHPPRLLHSETSWIAVGWAIPDVELRGMLPAAYALQYRLLVQNVTDPHDPRAADIANYQCCYEGAALTAEVTGLKPGRLYAVRVMYTLLPHFAPQAAADQQTSGPLWAVTKASVPMGLTAPELTSRARNSLKLKWTAPREDGGRPIMGYMLFMRPPPMDHGLQPDAQGYVRVYEGPGFSHKVVRLKPGTSYQFRIQCCNMLGVSELSPVVTLITSASVPSTPAAPVLTDASADSVTLRWEPPHGNGEPVTSYVLEGDYGDGGDFHRVYNGDARECCVTKLEAGTAYRFRVAAVNAVGISMWSTICVAKTKLAPSKCPTQVKIISANRKHATLTWVAPGNTGGAAEVSYEVELKPLSRAALADGLQDTWLVVYQGKPAACTINSLKPGCKYQARVRALSHVGYGEYCPSVDFTTSADAPDAPEAPWVVTTNASSLHLAWAPPAHNGGAALTAYAVQLQHVGPLPQPMEPVVVYRGLELQCLVAELPPGQEYRFRVQALNSHGASPWSPFASGSTRASAPAAPILREQDINALSSTVEMQWQPPDCNGARITGYHVQLATAVPAITAAHSASCSGEPEGEAMVDSFSNFSDSSGEQLQPATPPNGPSGSGPPHTASHANSHRGHPATPNGVLHAADSKELEPVQADPQNSVHQQAGGQAENSEVDRAPCPHGPFTTAHQGLDAACTLTGLQPYTQYWVRAKACNSFGSSAWSNVCVFHTCAAPPGPPHALQAEGLSSSSMFVSWKEPLQQHGCAVVRYQAEVSPVPYRGKPTLQWQQCYNGTGPSCTVTHLHSGRAYCFRVRAANSRGFGEWSASTIASTMPGRPAAPEPPTFGQRTANSVRVKWLPPEEDGGSAIVEYRLEYSSAKLDGFTTAYSGSDTQARVAHLSAGTRYQFRVQAVTAAGPGPFSEAASITTALQPPHPPQRLSAALQTNVPDNRLPGLLITWAPPEPVADRADIASYELELQALRANGSLLQKQLLQVGARLSSHTLHGLEAGALYHLRMRCTGCDGAGAGDWSALVQLQEPVPAPKRTVAITEPRRRAKSAASRAVEVTAMSGPGRVVEKGVSAAVAKPPPRKGWRQLLSRRKLWWLLSWVMTILLSAAGLALFVKMLRA